MGIVNLIIMFISKNAMDGVVNSMEKNMKVNEE